MNNLHIKKIRKNLDLSQTDFGKMLGVGLRTVQLWESGDRNISDSAKIILENKIKGEKIAYLNEHEQEVKNTPLKYILGKEVIYVEELSELAVRNKDQLTKDPLFKLWIDNVAKDALIKLIQKESKKD